MFFKPQEFRCRCARPACDAPPMDAQFLALLARLRARWGQPMIITSATRCTYWNEHIKGATHSQHLVGKAVDILASPDEAEAIAVIADELGFGGVEIGRGFVHVDTGPKREWTYL